MDLAITMSSKEFDSTVCTLRFIEAKDKIEISAHDKGAKPKRYAFGDNIICYICVTAGAGPPGRGGCTRTLRDVRKRYKNTAMHKNVTRCTKTLQDVRERCYFAMYEMCET